VPEAAWDAANWSSFAKIAVPLQDFGFQYMVCGNKEEEGRSSPVGRFVHFDYGLGDNDFGSVHAGPEARPLCQIMDGDWSGDDEALCGALEKAAEDDAAVNDRWAILDLPPALHVAEAKKVDGKDADNYGGNLHLLSFGTYVDFWDTDGSEFLRLTSRSGKKTCILLVDGNAPKGRSPNVEVWQESSGQQLRCRVERTLEWQQRSFPEHYPGGWCTRWRVVAEEAPEQDGPSDLVVV
jgi:hypothetical protein